MASSATATISLVASNPKLWCNAIANIRSRGISASAESYLVLQGPERLPNRLIPARNEISGRPNPNSYVYLMYLDSSRVACANGVNWFRIDTSASRSYYGWRWRGNYTSDVGNNFWQDLDGNDIAADSAECSSHFQPPSAWLNWDDTPSGFWAQCAGVNTPNRLDDEGDEDEGIPVAGMVDSLYHLGMYHLQRGEYTDAFALFREVIQNHPEHDLAAASLMMLFWAAREYDLYRLEEAGGDEEDALEMSTVLSELQTLRASNGPLAALARSYVPRAKVAMKDYEGALADYRDIINSPLSEDEEIQARIDSQIVALLSTESPILAVGQSRVARAYRITQQAHELRRLLSQQNGILASLSPPEDTPPVIDEEPPVESLALPDKFELQQCYPNPFNPVTVVRFALPQDVQVRLDVFNIVGQKVVTLIDKPMEAGWHSVSFDGSGLASGVYIYRIEAGSFVDSKKMVLIR